MESNQIQQYETQLEKMQAVLEQYRQIFNEDGIIDSKEQQQLDLLEHDIQLAKEAIATAQKRTEEPEDEMHQSLLDLREAIAAKVAGYGIQ